MQTAKLTIDYNETTEQPELRFVMNTTSEDISDKMLRRFVELVADPLKKVVVTNVANQNGTTNINFNVENL